MRKIFIVAISALASFTSISVLAAPSSVISSMIAADAEKASKAADVVVEENRTVGVGVEDVVAIDFPIGEAYPTVEGALQIKQGENQIRVIPMKKGGASLVILDANKKVKKKINYVITANDLSRKVEALKYLLNDIEGISINLVDDRIIVDGELVVPRDYDRVWSVIEPMKDEAPIINLVSVSKFTLEAIGKKIEEKIRKQTYGQNVNVEVMNDNYVLVGSVDDSTAKTRAVELANAMMPEFFGSIAQKSEIIKQAGDARNVRRHTVIDQLEVNEPAPTPEQTKMLRVTWHFVEISKEYLKSALFKWQPLASHETGMKFGNSSTGGLSSTGTFSGLISNLIPKLNAATNGGFARILYSAVGIGIAREDSEITISRSIVIPYAVSQGAGSAPSQSSQDATAQFRVFKIKPQGDEKIEFNSFVELTTLVGNTPGLMRKNATKLTNALVVRSGESAVLGGFISSDMAKDIDKDPDGAVGAAGTTPLFNLLKSKSFRNQKTQFVVFLTPKLISDASNDTADIRAKIINNNKKRQRTIKLN